MRFRTSADPIITEVLLPVRLQHVLHRQPIALRNRQVFLDVPPRSDQRRFASIPDQVRAVREARRLEFLEEHARNESTSVPSYLAVTEGARSLPSLAKGPRASFAPAAWQTAQTS